MFPGLVFVNSMVYYGGGPMADARFFLEIELKFYTLVVVGLISAFRI